MNCQVLKSDIQSAGFLHLNSREQEEFEILIFGHLREQGRLGSQSWL